MPVISPKPCLTPHTLSKINYRLLNFRQSGTFAFGVMPRVWVNIKNIPEQMAQYTRWILWN